MGNADYAPNNPWLQLLLLKWKHEYYTVQRRSLLPKPTLANASWKLSQGTKLFFVSIFGKLLALLHTGAFLLCVKFKAFLKMTKSSRLNFNKHQSSAKNRRLF